MGIYLLKFENYLQNIWLLKVWFRSFQKFVIAKILNTLIPSNFAQLSNSYICTRIIFAHRQNLYFRLGLSHDWKCSARHCVKYAKIRAFSDPYFPQYGQNRIRIFPYLDRIRDSVQIRENTDTILPTYEKMRIRESPYFGIFHTVREQELDGN